MKTEVDKIKGRQETISQFDELYQSYRREIYNFCYRFFYNSSDAEDVSHDVFLAVYQYRESYDAKKGSIQSWLYKIAYHACCRYRKKNQDLNSVETINIDSYVVENAGNIDQQIQIEQLLSKLKAEYRIPVILTKIKGFTIRECARILEISESNVKQRIFRGMKALRILSGGE